MNYPLFQSASSPIVGQNANTPIDMPWISDVFQDWPQPLQWILFLITFSLGALAETLINSRLVYPCLAETATLIQSAYLVAHFFVQFQETEHSNHIIAMIIFASHFVKVYTTDMCFPDAQTYTLKELRQLSIQEWNENYGGLMQIELMSHIAEIVIDIERVQTLRFVDNFFELGYFTGKMITNVFFTTLMIGVSVEYEIWRVRNELETAEEEGQEETSDDSISLLAKKNNIYDSYAV